MKSLPYACILCCLLVPSSASAEWREKVIAGELALTLPSFAAATPDFATVGWGAGVRWDYGISHDFHLGLAARYSQSSASTRDYRATVNGSERLGTLAFDSHVAELEATTRWKILGRYRLAPYLEAGAGLALAVYDAAELLDSHNRLLGSLGTIFEPLPSVHVALFFEYRIYDSLLIGAGVRASYSFLATSYGGGITFPIRFGYSWW